MRDQLIRDGLTQVGPTISFAFPVFSWTLDLEVQHEVALTASERTVLILAGEGLGTTRELARAMGFGEDQRLVASAASELLEAGGLAIEEGRLVTTRTGQGMLATARLARRKRINETAYYHPLDRRWSWNKPERPPNDVKFTIELASEVAPPRDRRDEIRDLLRRCGSPELAARSAKGESPTLELLDLQEVSNSVAYERVEIERWRMPDGTRPTFLGFRDGELDHRLTQMVEGANFQKRRRRLIVRAPE